MSSHSRKTRMCPNPRDCARGPSAHAFSPKKCAPLTPARPLSQAENATGSPGNRRLG